MSERAARTVEASKSGASQLQQHASSVRSDVMP